jgi:hypothetical protein
VRRSGWLEVLWIRFWIRFSNSWIRFKRPLGVSLGNKTARESKLVRNRVLGVGILIFRRTAARRIKIIITIR